MADTYEIETHQGDLAVTRFTGPADEGDDRWRLQVTTVTGIEAWAQSHDHRGGHVVLNRVQARKLIAELRKIVIDAVYDPSEPDVWIILCSCGHQWIWDRAETERDDPWGCANCGLAPPAELAARKEP